jgi:hypothetical protein
MMSRGKLAFVADKVEDVEDVRRIFAECLAHGEEG